MNKKKLIILISIIIALAVLLGVGIFVLSGNKGSQIEDKLDMGEKYLEELQYEKALAVYNEILEIDPKNVDAYLGIVDTYIAMGDYENALEYAEIGYEETGDAKLETKVKEAEAMLGGATSIDASKEDGDVVGEAATGNTVEVPVATPEPEKLLEGTEELEITVPEGVEVLFGNGGVIITEKDGMYGAVNYAGEELVPNMYNCYYLAPNKEGYFVLANEWEDENVYLTMYDAFVFDSTGQTKLVIEDAGLDLTLCGNRAFYETIVGYSEDYYIYTVQLYDLVEGKTLFSTGEIESDWLGPTLFVSDTGTFYYVFGDCYELQVNEESVTPIKKNNLSTWDYISNISGGYAYANIVPTDEYKLISEDGVEEYDCSPLLWDYNFGSYFDNDLSKLNKGKSLVVKTSQYAEEQKYHLVNMNYAKFDEWGRLANIDEVIVASFDYIGMSDSPYILVADGDKYFYVDENGQIVHDSFLDYTEFYGGYAMVVDTNGCAYMIDEDFDKVAGGYEADSIVRVGSIFYMEKDGMKRYIARPKK